MSDSSSTSNVSNFIRTFIEEDLRSGKWASIVTRFPPEPNGFLHIGHAKSICLNFGLAQSYGGVCHLRFDDTNPEKEDALYVEAIKEAVSWLGFSWQKGEENHCYFASDYFEKLYECAEILIQQGKAYVDSQDTEQIRKQRGTLTENGINSPFRNRSISENLALFRRMRSGEFAEGTQVLRAKIDMSSPNINLRNPVLYRIRHAAHYRCGNKWCIYPLYDYTHCISDALEKITHSLCSLEFENHRPLYNWILNALADAGVMHRSLPQQIEFARLNLTYAVTSKRKLLQLIQNQQVSGWDDPLLSTLSGLRRRGFTAESIHLFCERIGVAKADSWIEMGVLEQAVRDDLENKAARAMAVLHPLKLIIDNFPENHTEHCRALIHPLKPEWGNRTFSFTRTLWIEREDFAEHPPKAYFRLFPGNHVRLRYGFVIECTGCDKDEKGNIIAVHAHYFEDSRSGTQNSNNYKVKGNIHWVSVQQALSVEVRLYDRLFCDPYPDHAGKDFLALLNPQAKQKVNAYVEPDLHTAEKEQRFQFERQGYFVVDLVDSQPGKPVFNRIVTLKDSWGKINK